MLRKGTDHQAERMQTVLDKVNRANMVRLNEKPEDRGAEVYSSRKAECEANWRVSPTVSAGRMG
jgi:hypothetical protein